MTVKDEIEDRLTAAFRPSVLKVENESHKHAGHAGDDGSGASHFHITIRAEALAAMNRVARHRAVQAALGMLEEAGAGITVTSGEGNGIHGSAAHQTCAVGEQPRVGADGRFRRAGA